MHDGPTLIFKVGLFGFQFFEPFRLPPFQMWFMGLNIWYSSVFSSQRWNLTMVDDVRGTIPIGRNQKRR